MKRQKRSYIKILNKVVEHIKTQGRALNNMGNCSYRTRNGKRCAVGMFVADDRFYPEMEGKSIRRFKDIDFLLVDEAKGFHRDFWNDLQSLHDQSGNWIDICGEVKLSVIGSSSLARIVRSIDKGVYKRR